MTSYLPKHQMPEGFTIQGNTLTPEQYDKLVDAYPWAYVPNQEYFQELKKKEEEEEKLEFLKKVSPKTTSRSALAKQKKGKAKKSSPSLKEPTPPPL